MEIVTKKIKLKNRRVRVGRIGDGVYLGFTRLKEEEGAAYVASTITGRVATTELMISKAAAVALYYLLAKELTLEDLAEYEKESRQKLMP